MRDIAVLLPVCRPHRVVMMYGTFQNILEWMTAKKGSQEQQLVCERKELVSAKISKQLQCSYTYENSTYNLSEIT